MNPEIAVILRIALIIFGATIIFIVGYLAGKYTFSKIVNENDNPITPELDESESFYSKEFSATINLSSGEKVQGTVTVVTYKNDNPQTLTKK